MLELTTDEIESVWQATGLDWGAVDPSIFGTLFERGMDPAKRSQIGAHYTSRQDIETLIEPVIMVPLRREWEQIKKTVENLLTTGEKSPKFNLQSPKSKTSKAAGRKAKNEAERMIQRFLEDLARLKILDPACGSGNFLYVALQKLKDLEKQVILFAMARDLGGFLPMVGPWQLYGIEINPYAFELAQMTVWIGYLQWTRANGFGIESDPVLRPMNSFKCMDAILEWPSADSSSFVVPPSACPAGGDPQYCSLKPISVAPAGATKPILPPSGLPAPTYSRRPLRVFEPCKGFR